MTKGNISLRVWTQVDVEPNPPFAFEEGDLALDRELLGVLDNSISRGPNSPRLMRRGDQVTLWCNPQSARQPLVVQGAGFDTFGRGLGGSNHRWKVLPARISNVGRMVASARVAAALLSSLPKGQTPFSHYLFTLPGVQEPEPDASVAITTPAIIVLGDAALEVTSEDGPESTSASGRWKAWRLNLDDCLERIEDPAPLLEFANGRHCPEIQLPGASEPEPFEQAQLSAARVLRRSAQPWLFVPALMADESARLALVYKTSFDADPYAAQGLIVSDADPQNLATALVQHLGARDTVSIGLPTEAPPSTRFSVSEKPVLTTFGRISTSNPQLAGELEQLGRLGASGASVLFLGEPGVGKRSLAEELHRLSTRATRALVKLPCAKMSADELHSALREARHGSLLFEEIDRAPLDLQRLIVRELAASHVDVRLLSTCSADLASRIRDGSFDPDLYARLADVTIGVPPLRDRREDIPLLARQVLNELAPGRMLSASALQAFMRYSFPENLSELRRVLERGLALHDGERLDHSAFSLGSSQTYRPPASVTPGSSRRN